MGDPLVSVIIPTYNSRKTIDVCLGSIKHQSHRNIELIVVDACSTDGTLQISERYGARAFLLSEERSPARNFGAMQAQGEFLLFVDSDMELAPSIVKDCATICVQKNAGVVTIPEESIGGGFLARCKKMEKAMHRRQEYCEAPRFFRREVFEFIGGYDESLVIGEDFELTQRIRTVGFTINRCKARIRHHEEHLSLRRIVSKSYYYGKTLPTFAKKAPSLALRTSSPVHFLRNLSLLRKEPVCFSGLCSLKLIEYAAYSSGAFSSIIGKPNRK
jgi:glycosyltransferase involved in cell wall biosynthesis